MPGCCRAGSGRPWSVEELDAMSDNRPMTAEQAVTLKQLAKDPYELDAFKPNLTRAEPYRDVES
jgi:hypothetical protein